ncbi:MAG: TRAP transporter large permease [Phycisphaerae bacterium]
MTPVEVGILGCLVLVLLLAGSMPVAFAMAIVGLVGFAKVVSPEAAVSMATTELYDTFSKHSLTVIPLFVLMGQVAFHCGISRRLFSTAYHWFGPLPGGLAMATVGACTAFGAICGSGPATAATMSLVALPEMKRYGYSMELACGTVASGGTLGMMIPPSVVFIVYGIMTEQSIGKLFISGILPGLLTASLFALFIYVECKRQPAYGPAAPSTSWRAKFASLLGVSETLALFVPVIGGMFAGFFTPTEGAAIGAGGTILIALARRQLAAKMLWRALQETMRTSLMVIIIVAGAMIFGRFLTVTSIPSELAAWLGDLPLPPWVIVGLIIAFFIIAGCFVDALALILLTVPIFRPIINGLYPEQDPLLLIWFGVIIVLVTQIGTITPPVGVCAYVVGGIERDVPLQTVFKGCMPFVMALVIVTALCVAFPQICTYLPSMVR